MPGDSIIIEERLVDAIRCQCDLSDKNRLLELMKQAATSVGARILESHCTQYDPYGATLALLLAESHILLSTWPEYAYVTINIFLCNKNMSTTRVRDQLLSHLRPAIRKERLFRHVINDPTFGLNGCRIFLAAPFTKYICPIRRSFPLEKREPIQAVASALRAHGADVFLAHEREAWGHALMHANDCTMLDFLELQSSDVVVAIINSPSYGVCIELGWASALQLPIILFDETQRGVSCTPLLQGLWGITHCDVVRSIDEVIALLEDLGNIAPKQMETTGK